MKLKQIIALCMLVLVVVLASSCSNKIGFLKTDNAGYNPDSLVIPLTPDPFVDRARIQNKTPWVSPFIEGVLGTQPISYAIESVEALDGTPADANAFQDSLAIHGAGAMYYPLVTNTKPGHYRVSVRISNQSYSNVVKKVFVFVVVDHR